MPDWGNFANDAAYWLNWTIYALPIVLLCLVGPALIVMIVVVSVMKIEEYKANKLWRKFDKAERKANNGKRIKP